jgi:neutral ceramidase
VKKGMVYLLVLITVVLSMAQEYRLTAGSAKVDITPPIGIWLCGWLARDRPSTDIADNLYAKAVVIDDGRTKIVVVTTDLLKTYPDVNKSMKEEIYQRTGLDADHVLITASHTHFSPCIGLDSDKPYVNDYTKTVIAKIAGLVERADRNRQPVWIGCASGKASDLTFNRRVVGADGTIQMHWRMPGDTTGMTFGPIDPEVGVIRFDNHKGELVASLINYSTHPVCGMNEMYSISADYPAYTMQLIERIEGGVSLFSLGASGNQVPVEREGNSRVEIGRALGAEALEILQGMPVYNGFPIGVSAREIVCPTQREIAPTDSIRVKIQVFAIGEIILVALPGEVFVELGLELKNKIQHPLYICQLSNGGNVGYILNERDYAEGGYEAISALLAPGMGEYLIDEAAKMIGQLTWCTDATKVVRTNSTKSTFEDYSQKGYDIRKEEWGDRKGL